MPALRQLPGWSASRCAKNKPLLTSDRLEGRGRTALASPQRLSSLVSFYPAWSSMERESRFRRLPLLGGYCNPARESSQSDGFSRGSFVSTGTLGSWRNYALGFVCADTRCFRRDDGGQELFRNAVCFACVWARGPGPGHQMEASVSPDHSRFCFKCTT